MEPVSVAGLAAGAVQFADVGGRALLGTIRLLRNLKQTPERMRELLRDLEKSVQRIQDIQDTAQQPTSNIFSHLGDIQRQRATESINEAYKAIADLQSTLSPVFEKHNTSCPGWTRKAWRSVVSVTMEKDVAQKLDRIERLKRDMMCELQLTEIDTQMKNRYSMSLLSLDGLLIKTQRHVYQITGLRSSRSTRCSIQAWTAECF